MLTEAFKTSRGPYGSMHENRVLTAMQQCASVQHYGCVCEWFSFFCAYGKLLCKPSEPGVQSVSLAGELQLQFSQLRLSSQPRHTRHRQLNPLIIAALPLLG